jgi:hypothetical protein
VRDDCSDFTAGYAVPFGVFHVIGEREVQHPARNKRSHRENRAHFKRQRISVPYLPEEHIVVYMREFGRKIAQTFSSCCLFNTIRHFNTPLICASGM